MLRLAQCLITLIVLVSAAKEPQYQPKLDIALASTEQSEATQPDQVVLNAVEDVPADSAGDVSVVPTDPKQTPDQPEQISIADAIQIDVASAVEELPVEAIQIDVASAVEELPVERTAVAKVAANSEQPVAQANQFADVSLDDRSLLERRQNQKNKNNNKNAQHSRHHIKNMDAKNMDAVGPIKGAENEEPSWEVLKHDTGLSSLMSYLMSVKKKEGKTHCSLAHGVKSYCLCNTERKENFACTFDCTCADGVCEASSCRASAGFIGLIALTILSLIALPAMYMKQRHDKMDFNGADKWTSSRAFNTRSAYDSDDFETEKTNRVDLYDPPAWKKSGYSEYDDDSVSIAGTDISERTDITNISVATDFTSDSALHRSGRLERDSIIRRLHDSEKDRRMKKDKAQNDPDARSVMSAPSEKRIAIIGGGMACISTAEELVSRSLQVTIVEKQTCIRGTWSRCSPNSMNIPLAQFSAWNLPKSFPKTPNEVELQTYLNQYVDEQRLRHLFRFNTTMTKLVMNTNGTYSLSFLHLNGERSEEQFDEVIFSTGMFSNPLVPVFAKSGVLNTVGNIADINSKKGTNNENMYPDYSKNTKTGYGSQTKHVISYGSKTNNSKSYTDTLNATANKYLDHQVSLTKENASTVNNTKVHSPRAVRRSRHTPIYLPVTLDHPRNFANKYNNAIPFVGKKHSELIVVTMYNEHGDELAATVQGVLQNHENYVRAGGRWDEAVLVIVSDGATKMSESSLNFAQNFGLMAQENIDMNSESEVDTHIWYSVPEVEKDNNIDAYPPIQVVFVLKDQNKGKLHSHMWAFMGIAPVVKPTYLFLIDVGTVPSNSAVQMLYEAMEADKSIGGCCGEITPTVSCNALNWAQSFEYKISHVLDKSFESMFGFISVLPGAFSAYRYKAVEGRPLEKYFSSFQKKLSDLGAFRANMYLAEDRILCFELLCQKDQAWTLHYVKGALATTDAPATLLELLKQRRRWLNGSFFAMVYILINITQFWKGPSHSFARKTMITLEFIYYALTTFVNWFMIGSLFVCVYFTLKLGVFRENEAFISGMLGLYVLSIILQLIFALGHKPDHLEWIYQGIAFAYAVMMILLLYTALDYALVNQTDPWFRLAFLITFGGYFIAGAMHGEWSVFTYYLAYFFMLPTFLTIFTIYSFCNIDDLSWGTKNSDQTNEERKARDNFQVFRTKMLMSWLLSNLALVMVLTLFDLNRPYIVSLAIVGAAFTGVRLIGSFLYLASQSLSNCSRKKKIPSEFYEYEKVGPIGHTYEKEPFRHVM